MDASYYDELRGRLLGLLIQLSDRLDQATEAFTQELLDHNELALGLETMAEALSDLAAPISHDERAQMLTLVADMSMDEFVPTTLNQCPSST